ITGNEIRGNGVTNSSGAGIDLSGDDTQFTMRGNLVAANSGFGIDLLRASGGGRNETVDQNTITGNGAGGTQTAGIRLAGPDSRVTSNLIATNAGAGVLGASNTQSNTISRNSTFNNGTLGIDLLSASDNQNTGTAPYVTRNDPGDVDSGGNGLLNFPILATAG